MRKTFALITSLLGLLLAVSAMAAGCAPAREVKLGADANGREIDLKKGQVLVVSLEGNPTTGYTWEVQEPLDEQVLRQMGEAEFKAASDQLGAPGVLTFRFQAMGTGRTTLQLIYHRPWEEKGAKPLKTFSVQVVVR